MTDLIYPSRTAPVIRGGAGKKSSEMLPVLDEDGHVYRQASRKFCHSGTKVLHPVVHLHILNRFGELYLQRRSLSKDLLPGYWDTAIGGHINYGERVLEALCREAGEELGICDFNPHYIKTYLFESETERELVFVFAAIGNYEPKPDGVELMDGGWWSEEKISNAIGKGILTPNFESEYLSIKDSLMSLL